MVQSRHELALTRYPGTRVALKIEGHCIIAREQLRRKSISTSRQVTMLIALYTQNYVWLVIYIPKESRPIEGLSQIGLNCAVHLILPSLSRVIRRVELQFYRRPYEMGIK